MSPRCCGPCRPWGKPPDPTCSSGSSQGFCLPWGRPLDPVCAGVSPRGSSQPVLSSFSSPPWTSNNSVVKLQWQRHTVVRRIFQFFIQIGLAQVPCTCTIPLSPHVSKFWSGFSSLKWDIKILKGLSHEKWMDRSRLEGGPRPVLNGDKFCPVLRETSKVLEGFLVFQFTIIQQFR